VVKQTLLLVWCRVLLFNAYFEILDWEIGKFSFFVFHNKIEKPSALKVISIEANFPISQSNIPKCS
jgi:hypothetical protein